MIAKVAFPIAVPGIFDYTVPDAFASQTLPGVPVRVELQRRELWGVVVELAEKTSYPHALKPVLEVKKSWTQNSHTVIELYQWMAAYYQTGLGKVFKPFIRKGVADIAPKTVNRYRFTGILPDTLTRRQREAAARLKDMAGEFSRQDLMQIYDISPRIFSAFVRLDVLRKEERRVVRELAALERDGSHENVTLTDEQVNAVECIWSHPGNERRPFLLYGITGSGKTHVYIELVKRTLAQGKSAMILVPEISLTPQTIQRFRDAIGAEIAVIHSRMSDGERRDSIEELVSGRKRIVIGVRSAVLAPLEGLGLIVVDEEHDGSYKQSDMEPRYHARDVAVKRGALQKAVVVLGSATPSFESYTNALDGKYTLVTLVRRFGEAALPQVRIVDMNREHRENNWSFLSRYLHEKIAETLAHHRQIILLLNRRGFSTILICKECGHVYRCTDCSLNLIYHRSAMSLQCHQCGYTEAAPSACGACGGEQIQYKGAGIQKVEEYLGVVFPQARILRMDQDSTRGKGRHLSILQTFAQREADILLGTQMVAKGLNFPGVRLVGVLQADIGLHLPDFRAAEKTFQLLAQVAGRAGRKDSQGEVVIQTYSPQEPGIRCAQTHDFDGFYRKEIGDRRALAYPPFNRLARILVQGDEEGLVQLYIRKVAETVFAQAGGGCTVLGPSPAVLARLKKAYRYSILIKYQSPRLMQLVLRAVRKKFSALPREMKLIIDVDPVNML